MTKMVMVVKHGVGGYWQFQLGDDVCIQMSHYVEGCMVEWLSEMFHVFEGRV